MLRNNNACRPAGDEQVVVAPDLYVYVCVLLTINKQTRDDDGGHTDASGGNRITIVSSSVSVGTSHCVSSQIIETFSLITRT